MPYFYTLLREASESGMPLMRPLFFDDFTDKNLRSEEQVFLLGKDLLVVPRWAENPKLPKGNWNKVTLETTEDDGYQALLYVKSGGVIPIGEVIQSTSEYKSDKITFLINPTEKGKAEGTIYYDNGEGFGYKTNDFALHKIEVSKHNSKTLKVVIKQTEGNKKVNRTCRIGYVTDNGVVYSDWSSNDVIYVPIIKDKTQNIQIERLKK